MATQVVIDDIVKYFHRQNFAIGIGERNTISFMVEGEHGEYDVLIYYPWEREIIASYVNYSFRIQKKNRRETFELVARINWGLLFGTCECQPDTGVVRFRSIMLTDGTGFIEEQFATMLSTCVTNAERYAPAFKAVLGGKATAAQALIGVER